MTQSAAKTSLDATMKNLREQAWAGSAEAQREYLALGARRADSVQTVLQDVDDMVRVGRWRPAK